jgi:hypothetical protein
VLQASKENHYNVTSHAQEKEAYALVFLLSSKVSPILILLKKNGFGEKILQNPRA